MPDLTPEEGGVPTGLTTEAILRKRAELMAWVDEHFKGQITWTAADGTENQVEAYGRLTGIAMAEFDKGFGALLLLRAE